MHAPTTAPATQSNFVKIRIIFWKLIKYQQYIIWYLNQFDFINGDLTIWIGSHLLPLASRQWNFLTKLCHRWTWHQTKCRTRKTRTTNNCLGALDTKKYWQADARDLCKDRQKFDWHGSLWTNHEMNVWFHQYVSRQKIEWFKFPHGQWMWSNMASIKSLKFQFNLQLTWLRFHNKQQLLKVTLTNLQTYNNYLKLL